MSNEFREISKQNYSSNQERPSIDQINVGSLQRIADATELMATNFVQLQNELQYYKNRTAELIEQRNKLQRSIYAYKANMTRKKMQIALLKNK